MELSVVVPVYRSAHNAVDQLPNIIEALRHKYRKFEVLFIIDCHDINTDIRTFLAECKNYKEINIHFLNRNYGQHFATLCGYYFAKGDFIACVDEDMCRFIPEICKSDDYKAADVYYFYYDKNEMYNSSVRKFFSNVYKYLINKIVNLKKHSTFRIISIELRDKILISKHYYWNLDVMIFDNANRIAGTTLKDVGISDENSNYNYKKLVKIAFEIAYENNPLIVHIILAFLPAVVFYLLSDNYIATFLFYIFLVTILSTLFMWIKKNTETTTAKILAAVKH